MTNKMKPLTKKILSGKYKGTTLQLPSKNTTRSSKAIVLESFFNTLQFDIVDCHFVEVFSGSGSIGLEALSRGAEKVYFMEKDKDALVVLKKNIQKTDANSCEIIAGDSFENITLILKKLKKINEEAFFYIDPPFSIREGMEDIYEKMIQLISSLPSNLVQMIIIEHMSSLKIPENISNYKKKKTKKFGNTSLTYLKVDI